MPLHIYPTAEDVLRHLADYFCELVGQALAARGRFVVALSGGSSPKQLYELLASPAYRDKISWRQVYFFFGDERYVPPTDAESNYLMAKTALLAPLGILPEQVFAVDTSLPPAEAAQAYARTLEHFFAGEEARFDLVLLGLGDDAHTASLFPYTSVLHDASIGAKEVFLEDKHVFRITLTAPLLNQARAVAFLVYGAGKAAAVERVLTGKRDPDQFPAQLIAPAGELHWYLDSAAAALLPDSL
ncbi:6-phosphogluconolactonase [Hymenobacter sp. BT683]|uniref:6-phosphogluconolactonase n=1 Tax=Hymenobacter jeongseonensis TaxID=2791027 RepID=A0ABS0IED1_9BACT|nr:6-phosphogluconolactonase [Hymenobacter jeongseonensis]MBF9236665.1 6-phosphogluconolactonase [Hymenobacter jeongseonensis]